jgi:hypothetical protein
VLYGLFIRDMERIDVDSLGSTNPVTSRGDPGHGSQNIEWGPTFGKGRGSRADDRRNAEYLIFSADRGNADTQLNNGLCLRDGRCVG